MLNNSLDFDSTGGLAFDKTGEVHLLFTTTALCEKQTQNSVPFTFHQVARVR